MGTGMRKGLLVGSETIRADEFKMIVVLRFTAGVSSTVESRLRSVRVGAMDFAEAPVVTKRTGVS